MTSLQKTAAAVRELVAKLTYHGYCRTCGEKRSFVAHTVRTRGRYRWAYGRCSECESSIRHRLRLLPSQKG